MELVVFDLDGTLLNARAEISPYTRETLALLADKGIAYTVATGRTLHGARDILAGHQFNLPQIFTNGVVIWDPRSGELALENFLTLPEIEHVLHAALDKKVTPFISTVEAQQRHVIYHFPLQNDTERQLLTELSARSGIEIKSAARMSANAEITNISFLADAAIIEAIDSEIKTEPDLIAYSAFALEGNNLKWMDIHHCDASKGGAITNLRRQLGAKKIICFGDSDNDLSMFAQADESYAPENANAAIKAKATAIIGHHDQDGIAHYLRKRFEL